MRRLYHKSNSQSFGYRLRDAPTAATFLGDHRYDDQLGDYSKAAVEDQRRRLCRWQERSQAYAVQGWSSDAKIDRTPDDAKAEVRRCISSPTQPQCYLMGKMQILDIVAEYKRRFPGASMLQMHDDVLRCGSLPPRLMRERLFEAG